MEVNKIYNMECIAGMKEKIADDSINLVITSPPYNVGIDYDSWNDKMELEDYINFSEKWIKEVYRVLKKDGRFALNVADMINQFEMPLSLILGHICLKTGFRFYGKIIWVQKDRFNSTAWGSWKSASCPCFINEYENILVFYKESKKRLKKGKDDLLPKEFKQFVHTIWEVNTSKNKKHPATFPIELPYRLIKLLSFQEDIVLDPFMGSGTTAEACIRLNRQYIGFEISKSYCDTMKCRTNQERLSATPRTLPTAIPTGEFNKDYVQFR